MFFKNLKNKLYLLVILLTLFSIPISTYAYSSSVYLGGENIGIEINSKGVLVVGFYNINNNSPGKKAGLKIGDIITRIDDTAISEIADLSKVINNSSNSIKITYLRNNQAYTTDLVAVKQNNVYKTGLYVKDSIIGIGTLTFIDPESLVFGALGHEIVEKSTNHRFEIENGKIFKSTISSINKSTRNNPGEKNAKYYTNEVYGTITNNEKTGIYGKYKSSTNNKELINIALKEEITTGKASIRTVINSDQVEEFEINILKVFFNDKTKNILFEITDNKLLKTTNGVVQGMSGSPIIQNNKLVGAVNYVIVDSPNKGYGIFITNMLEEADKIE